MRKNSDQVYFNQWPDISCCEAAASGPYHSQESAISLTGRFEGGEAKCESSTYRGQAGRNREAERQRRKARPRVWQFQTGTKTKRAELIPLPWAFSLSTTSPCCHRECSQASNRKFIMVKLTSVISIFTHCTKCFYVYVKPFLELIFHVYGHFC